MGASTALNVVAAEMMAKELGAGKTIVTILCGTAEAGGLTNIQMALIDIKHACSAKNGWKAKDCALRSLITSKSTLS